MLSPLRTLAAIVACAALASACGVPPELRDPPGDTVPSPKTEAPPTPTPSSSQAVPTPSPSRSGFSEETAVSCGGRPTGAQVIAAVRRSSGLLPSGTNATVRTGDPLCAGAWQYAVVLVPNSDPLIVVTRGKPGSLTVVTAGTDVCSIPVRTEAPAGIRTLACDGEPNLNAA
ncbi:hypothetical protein [Micromonospora sp. CPCC 206061]|uniref:hypothetical protein n=1 Tax=Micromonospora sp. CPCC 206061 TaxID=3122410 RepID=UPI002FF11613